MDRLCYVYIPSRIYWTHISCPFRQTDYAMVTSLPTFITHTFCLFRLFNSLLDVSQWCTTHRKLSMRALPEE
jgi:hypothetical protein